MDRFVELGTPESAATEPVPANDGRAARMDGLQARAHEAARRIDSQRAELKASSQHTARIERDTQAEPQGPETSYEMEC